MKVKSYTLQVLGCLLVLGLCLLYGLWSASPTVKPGDETQTVIFDKTMEHLENISAKPHASGSEAIEEVRQYLADELEQLGVNYEVERFILNREDTIKNLQRFCSVEEAEMIYREEVKDMEFANILVKLDAPDTEEGIMFVSHYDSVAEGPGAADDGISVASMMAVIEDTITQGTPANDMYFLFTDGEEKGLFGAMYFTEKYTDIYKDKVKLVINLEARGNKGPLLMFETSENDYQIANMLQSAVKSGSTPVSLAASLYKQMPNNTDLTLFLQHGFRGMNFAVIGGGEDYHTEYDAISELNEDTAYMYCATVSELADYLRDYDLSKLEADNMGVYFPIAKGKFLLFNETFMNIITVISMLAFLVILIYLCRRHDMCWKKMLLSTGLLVGTIVVSLGIAFLFDKLGASILHNMGQKEVLTARMVVSVRESFIFPLLAITVVLILATQIGLQGRIGTFMNHLCTYGILFEIATLVLFIVFREVVYLVSLILFVITLILLVELFFKKKDLTAFHLCSSAILTWVTAIIFIPIAILVYQALFLGEAGYDLTIFTVLLVSLCAGALVQAYRRSTL